MRILVLNPNFSESITERLVATAAKAAAPGSTIGAATAPRGVPYISTRAEAQIGGANETISFERHDHLVDRRRADSKVALQVGLGRWASEYVRVSIDESQVLALLFGEALPSRVASGA